MIVLLRQNEAWRRVGDSPIDALLFDLDGTLFDSFEFHFDAYRKALRQLGSTYELTWEEFLDVNVRGSRKFDGQISSIDSSELYRVKTNYLRASVRGRLNPVRGVATLIESLRDKGGRFAIVTAARPSSVEVLLEECWPLPMPDVIITRREAALPKPAPDSYLEAIRRLQTTAARCIAFEDAPTGVGAAVNAGVHCVGFWNGFFGPEEFAPNTEFIASFEDVRIARDG